MGKVFHDSADDPQSWTYGAARALGARPSSNYTMDMHRTNSDRIIILEGNGETHSDFKIADATIAKLREYATNQKSFFMTCGLSKPHSPPAAPKKWFDSLPLNTIPLPVDFKPEADATPEFPAAALPPPTAICLSSVKPAKRRLER